MASDINHVILVGRLTRDIELRYTNGGACVGRFSLAVNRNKRSAEGQWEEETGFFDIVLWGKQAESLSTYLRKGKQVAVEGELRQSRWEQDGQKKSKVEIAATGIQLLGGNAGGGNYGDNAPSAYSPAPAAPQANNGYAAPAGNRFQYQQAGNDSATNDFEDDIPF